MSRAAVFEPSQGLPEDGAAPGYGLHSMAERAELVGGPLEVRSRRGRGTTVTVRVPLA